MKKEYISPEFLFTGVTFSEVLSNSVENYSQYIAPTDDWGDNEPIIDDDDTIIWG